MRISVRRLSAASLCAAAVALLAIAEPGAARPSPPPTADGPPRSLPQITPGADVELILKKDQK